jgi:hypothetical protein
MARGEFDDFHNDELDGPASHRATTLPPRAPACDSPAQTSRRSMLLGAGSLLALAWTARSILREPSPPLAAAQTFSMPPSPSVDSAQTADAAPGPVPWPARRAGAPKGTAFARELRELGGHEREAVIARELAAGNVPDFLRRFVRVPLLAIDGSRATAPDRREEAIVFVLPDYLAIGSDDDFMRIPMMPGTAQPIADRLGCVMPTRVMVNAIHRHAQVKLTPTPLDSGPGMITTDEFTHHNEAIEEQRHQQRGALGALTAGHKKDVVITPRLYLRRNRVAIYGMHRRDGTPIQSLSLLHQANYVDYAHGVRLVAGEMLLGGKRRQVAEVIADPDLCDWLSDEGPLESPRYPRRS